MIKSIPTEGLISTSTWITGRCNQACSQDLFGVRILSKVDFFKESGPFSKENGLFLPKITLKMQLSRSLRSQTFLWTFCFFFWVQQGEGGAPQVLKEGKTYPKLQPCLENKLSMQTTSVYFSNFRISIAVGQKTLHPVN